MLRVLLTLLIVFSPVAAIAGNCGYNYAYTPSYSSYNYGGVYNGYPYSATYVPGYSYYGAGYYGGSYYPAGYYGNYGQKYDVLYVPYFAVTPVAFATFQPAALVQPKLDPVTNVPNMKANTDRLGALLDRIETRIAALERVATGAVAVQRPMQQAVVQNPQLQKQAQQVAKVQGDLNGVGVFVNRCGSCHGDDFAKKGGKIRLIEGQTPMKLDAKLLVECYRDVLSGKMPKGEQLTQDEGQKLVEFLGSLVP